MMDTKRLLEILGETTSQFRKGPVVTEETRPGLTVKHVYAMPHESEAATEIEKVDLHFVTIGVDKAKAEALRAELIGILNDWPTEAWGHAVPALSRGPSYIHAGGVVGDQGAALCLFALGKALGLWNVITPETLGFKGEEAAQMAGAGFLMIDGYHPEQMAA